MVRTQIQFPDDLHRDLKRYASAREWSLAETVRRAAEQFLARHPAPPDPNAVWRVPVSRTVGWRGLSDEEIRVAALEDAVRLPDKSRRHDGD